jgi:hypothetical protein
MRVTPQMGVFQQPAKEHHEKIRKEETRRNGDIPVAEYGMRTAD